MPNPLLTAPPEASPVTARNVVHDAPGWAALPVTPGAVTTAPVLSPLLTADLR